MSKGIIGVPTGNASRWSVFYSCLTRLQTPLETGINIQRGNSVSENRNEIIREALRTGAQWIFFLDDDLQFERDILLKLLSRNLDAVVGLSLQRKVPFAPLAYKSQDGSGKATQLNLTPDMKGLIEIDSSTAGGLLVKRKVFEKMKDPWFLSGQVSEAGEDFYFCMKLREAGFKLHLDTDTMLGHITEFTILPKKTSEGWRTQLIQSLPFVEIPPSGAETWKK